MDYYRPNRRIDSELERSAPVPKQKVAMTMNQSLMVNKVSSDFDLRSCGVGFMNGPFEKPFCIAPQYRRDVFSHLLLWRVNTVNDSAQIRLINAHELGQAILAHSSRIHSKLEIGIDTVRPFCLGNHSLFECATYGEGD